MIRRPPRSTPNYTRYPYTTRCRSGGDEGSGPQDCSLGQALRLQFSVEVSDLYGRLSSHVAYISGESAGKFQFCLGECFGRSAPRFLHHLAKLVRSEEHTSELQSLMRISYAVICLKQRKKPIW